MMNKKALARDVLMIIIAVGVLALLFFGAVRLYQLAVGDNDLKNAKNIAEKVQAKVDALQVGQNTTMTLAGFDPVGEETWVITGWAKEDPTAPDKCLFSSCVCVCGGPSYYLEQRPVADNIRSQDCQKRGVCEKVEGDVVAVGKRIIDPMDSEELEKLLGREARRITIKWVPVGETFSELQFRKTRDIEGKTVVVIKNE